MTGCIIELEHNIFNFNDLVSLEWDYNVTYKGTKLKPNNLTIFFNICDFVKKNKCSKDSLDSAHLINVNNTCKQASASSISDDQKVYLQNVNYPDYGVTFKYLNGEKCTDQLNYALEVQINCMPNKEKSSFYLDEKSLELNECHPKIIMESAAGCPVFSMGPLWKWSDNYTYLIGVVLIAYGSLLIWLGPKKATVSLSLTAFFGMFCFVLVFLHSIVIPSFLP